MNKIFAFQLHYICEFHVLWAAVRESVVILQLTLRAFVTSMLAGISTSQLFEAEMLARFIDDWKDVVIVPHEVWYWHRPRSTQLRAKWVLRRCKKIPFSRSLARITRLINYSREHRCVWARYPTWSLWPRDASTILTVAM